MPSRNDPPPAVRVDFPEFHGPEDRARLLEEARKARLAKFEQALSTPGFDVNFVTGDPTEGDFYEACEAEKQKLLKEHADE